MMVHQQCHPAPRPRRRRRSDGSKPINRRRHRMLPALAFLTLNEESLSLVLPGQTRCLTNRNQQCSIPTLAQHHGAQCCHHRRRIRSVQNPLQLELQFSSGHNDVMESSFLSNCSPFSPTFLQKCTPSISHPAINNDRRHNASSGRLRTTSLFMAQNSESTGGFGKKDDRKKKKDDSNDSSNRNKPKANKSVAKGTSSSSSSTSKNDATAASDRPKSKTKRSRRRNNNKMNTKKKRKNKTKSPGGKGKAKTKAASNYDANTLQMNKSSIKTTDGTNSLKGFKTEKPPVPFPQTEGQMGDSAKDNAKDETSAISGGDNDTQKRVVQLEMIVSKQQCELQKLRREIEDLTKAASVFSNVVDVLREAGLKIDEDNEASIIDDDNEDDVVGTANSPSSPSTQRPLYEQQSIHDDMEIFGIAPKSVTDAADAAGASILSAILAGKHRMLVDVRDAELTRDPKLFVEFIELAILPVAAGLEGLDDGRDDEYEHMRNRVKIVFPTVKELMSYRRSMALAAPEVVSLSTLGFDPVDEQRDNLIVVIAPSPDDVTAVGAMEKLIMRTGRNYVEPDRRITQPVVVLNHHMVPIDVAGLFGKFTSVYHLRLLSVQYMTGDSMPEYVAKENSKEGMGEGGGDNSLKDINKGPSSEGDKQNSTKSGDGGDEEDAALEAAMTHAHEIGVHQGVTRAMVIRAYPKPWHVFVDTSPDTDADFEVAATFDSEPTQEDVNYAIVECLEGSEKEDEIVAREMQAALEAGQLERVSDMLGISPLDIVDIVTEEEKKKGGGGGGGGGSPLEDGGGGEGNDDDNAFRDGDGDDLYYDDWFSEDTV